MIAASPLVIARATSHACSTGLADLATVTSIATRNARATCRPVRATYLRVLIVISSAFEYFASSHCNSGGGLDRQNHTDRVEDRLQ